jgi:hypothetical protein
MKPLEDAFASRTIRRIVLPGIVLTIGIHPALGGLLAASGDLYGIEDSGLILVIEILFWGLLISSAINPIYYIYEGFRLRWLTEFARSANEKRLLRKKAELERFQAKGSYDALEPADRDRISLLYEALQEFPLKRDAATNAATRFVDRPTRLGNIITTYELYPETRYDLDGVFFWHHLLALAPASVVSEFEDQYGFAESLLLTSSAGWFVVLANVGILIGLAIGSLWPSLVFVPVTMSVVQCLTLMVLGVIVGVLFYWLSLPAHAEAGKMFRTVVDLAVPPFREWIQNVSPASSELKEKIGAVHRHLDELQLPDSVAAQVKPAGLAGAFVLTLRRIARYCGFRGGM